MALNAIVGFQQFYGSSIMQSIFIVVFLSKKHAQLKLLNKGNDHNFCSVKKSESTKAINDSYCQNDNVMLPL